QLRLNNDRQTMAQARREALERQLADVETAPAAAAAPGVPDTPALRLVRLRQDLRELRTQYTEKYPEVVRVKTEIAVLERELGARGPEAAAAPAPMPQGRAVQGREARRRLGPARRAEPRPVPGDWPGALARPGRGGGDPVRADGHLLPLRRRAPRLHPGAGAREHSQHRDGSRCVAAP